MVAVVLLPPSAFTRACLQSPCTVIEVRPVPVHVRLGNAKPLPSLPQRRPGPLLSRTQRAECPGWVLPLRLLRAALRSFSGTPDSRSRSSAAPAASCAARGAQIMPAGFRETPSALMPIFFNAVARCRCTVRSSLDLTLVCNAARNQIIHDWPDFNSDVIASSWEGVRE